MTQDLQSKLTSIAGMSRPQLNAAWQTLFGNPAPRNAHLDLLRGALGWKAQTTPDDETALNQALRQWSAKAAAAKLKPGSRLIREWKGVRHEVFVLDRGFLYQDQIYRSLTAVTRAITQMGWSGPQFFGLRK